MEPNEQEIRDALKGTNIEHLTEQIIQAIQDLNQDAAAIQSAAVEGNLFGSDGKAFLWEDVLSLEDAGDALEGMAKLGDPVAAAKALLKLCLFWRKLRIVRVDLNADEYAAIRVVRRKSDKRKTADMVAAQLKWDVTRARDVLDGLTRREYRDGIRLAEKVGDAYSTRF